METTFNFPEFKEVRYAMNPATGYYEKPPQKITFNKLPFELKVEETHEEKIRSQGAGEIIHGRIKNGKYQFFTGLIPATVPDWYFGNDYEFIKGEKKLSLLIFHFAEEGALLTVYYFNWFYKYSRDERNKFVSHFIYQTQSQEPVKTKEAYRPPLSFNFPLQGQNP